MNHYAQQVRQAVSESLGYDPGVEIIEHAIKTHRGATTQQIAECIVGLACAFQVIGGGGIDLDSYRIALAVRQAEQSAAA